MVRICVVHVYENNALQNVGIFGNSVPVCWHTSQIDDSTLSASKRRCHIEALFAAK